VEYLKEYKMKKNQHQLIVTRADKGIALAIICKDDYYNKIKKCITNNHFEKLPHDITNKQQHNIRTSINNSNNVINKNKKWKYINMNPRAPQIYGTVKLHKPNQLI
jgi:hypothetical protein